MLKISEIKAGRERGHSSKLLDMKDAVSGIGPHAFNWQDKPHRVLYDAVSYASDLEAALLAAERLARAVDHERNLAVQDFQQQLDASNAVEKALAAYREHVSDA